MPYRRILCMDGGPASVTYVRCLQHLVQRHPALVLDVDLFAGASGGAFAAAFLARRLEGVTTAAGAAAACRDLVAANDGLLDLLTPDVKGYTRLLEGSGAMVEFDAVRDFLRRDDMLGADTTLGDLGAGIAIVAARTAKPWGPHVMVNFGPDAQPGLSLVDAVLRSSAFPLLLPGWQAHADGAMFANNPAVMALAYASSGGGIAPDALFLSFGGDDGSSRLANLTTPHDAFDADDPPNGHRGAIFADAKAIAERLDPLGIVGRVSSAARDAVALVTGGVEAAVDEVRDELGHLGHLAERGVHGPVLADFAAAFEHEAAEVRGAAGRIAAAARDATSLERAVQEGMATHLRLSPSEGGGHDEGADDWGWRAWMTYVFNPLYALQVLLNSQGRGAHDILQRLLGAERCLRIAPVGLVPSNVMLLGMVFAQPELARRAGAITADLWADPVTNGLLAFETSTADAEAFSQRWAAKRPAVAVDPAQRGPGGAVASD